MKGLRYPMCVIFNVFHGEYVRDELSGITSVIISHMWKWQIVRKGNAFLWVYIIQIKYHNQDNQKKTGPDFPLSWRVKAIRRNVKATAQYPATCEDQYVQNSAYYWCKDRRIVFSCITVWWFSYLLTRRKRLPAKFRTFVEVKYFVLHVRGNVSCMDIYCVKNLTNLCNFAWISLRIYQGAIHF